MAKTDWKKKQVNRIIENWGELDEKQQVEVMDAIKYQHALQAAKEVGMTKTVTFGDMYEIAEERQKFFNKYEGFGCGLPYFDQATMGFREGEITIIAGPSGFGKTMVSMNIVANVVAQTLKKVVMISMEMTPAEISTRLYNMVDKKYHDALKERFIIQTELNVSTAHVRAIIEKHKPDLVLIDHLGFLSKQEAGNDYEQINSAIIKVKRTAMDYKIPLILISHVAKTRSGSSGEATAADLKGSSSIEQDSDIILMINRSTLAEDSLVIVLDKHRTKKPDLYKKKCIVPINGVRINGEYTLWQENSQ